MAGDRERWDAKYRGAAGAERAPDPFVQRALASLRPAPGERALDLAAGTGRHALELARKGWRAAAWDVSSVGLELLAARAAREGLEVETRAVDLVAEPLEEPPESFAVVALVDFLHWPLWGRLPDLVASGGHVVIRTFTADWPGTKPPARYRLPPGALGDGLEGFETLLLEEAGGRAGLFGRRLGG